LHWGERRESIAGVPIERPKLEPEPERDPVVGEPFKEEEHRADNDAVKEAREQSERVWKKRHER